MNGKSGSLWKDHPKDTKDVARVFDRDRAQLEGKSAPMIAKHVEAQLKQELGDAWDRSWRAIMSQSGPPSVLISGVLTRARAARTLAEARANLEANRARDVEEESREQLSASRAALKEMERNLTKAKQRHQVIVRTVEINAADTATASKKAEDVRKEKDAQLDEKDRQLLAMAEQNALAEQKAEDDKEALEQAEKQRKEAENKERLAKLQAAYYNRKAKNAEADKRKLSEFLADSAQTDRVEDANHTAGFFQIEMMIDGGEEARAEAAIENLERALVAA